MDYRYSSKLIFEQETYICLKDSIASITADFSDDDFYIVDSIVYKKYGFNLKNYYLLNGELDKNIDTFLKIVEMLYRLNFGRTGKIWGIGGGVTTDVAGFVAALFKRGTELVFVPTTLLAMIDSSYGGKNGVNFHAKNMLGTFYAPSNIYICDDFLDDKRTLIDQGISELIKVAFLKKTVLIDRLKKGESFDMSMLFDAIKAKSCFCDADVRDIKGVRLFLNWGHTFGHAFERLLKISHGQAVAEGMLFEQRLAEVSGFDCYASKDIEVVLKRYGFESVVNYKEIYKDLINLIKVDKKNLKDTIKVVYLKSEGNPNVLEFNVFEITSYMEKLV